MERLVKRKKLQHKRKHGYLMRKKTSSGRRVLKRRLLKKRKRLT